MARSPQGANSAPPPRTPILICFGLLTCAGMLLGLLSAPGHAGALSLNMPLQCEYGRDCFVQNYVDTDPSKKFQDFQCGGLSYNGHTGTDFFVLPELYQRGVPVLAAAPGIVRAIRDGVPDMNMRVDPESIRGREAGNAVAITHDGGWETRYNHLRKGSVTVRPGDLVETGHVLGLVGMSGKTEFPHLELVVAYEKEAVDPFTGRTGESGCKKKGAPLWNAATNAVVRYIPTAAIGAGFTDSRHDVSAVRTGFKSGVNLTPQSNALIFWGTLFGARQGDVEIMALYGPDGRELAGKRDVVKSNQVRRMRSIGLLRGKGKIWRMGVYRGEYSLYRKLKGTLRRVGTAQAESILN